MPTNLKNPGTYILLPKLSQNTCIKIGRKGEINFASGTYAYVGSALGPGGLGSRLKRHASGKTSKHWHIDYLLAYTKIFGALVIENNIRHECLWASFLAENFVSSVSGFGATDCKCDSHLFYLGRSASNAIKLIQDNLQAQFIASDSFPAGKSAEPNV